MSNLQHVKFVIQMLFWIVPDFLHDLNVECMSNF